MAAPKQYRYEIAGMNTHQKVFSPDEGVFSEVAEISDMDPGKNGVLESRPGRVLVLPGQGMHSGWSSGTESFFVEGSALKQFYGTVNSRIIRVGLTVGAPMAFCRVNDVTAFSNGEEFGVISGGQCAPKYTPTMEHKSPMMPGTCLEFYNGRLYSALGPVLYCSDSLDVPGGIQSMDKRFNIVDICPSDIRMVIKTSTGLFVSDDEAVYFLSGTDQQVGGFSKKRVSDYPAARGTQIRLDSSATKLSDISARACMWVSSGGICVGMDTGEVIHLSKGKVSIIPGPSGTAMLRSRNGEVHYVFVLGDLGLELNAKIERTIPVNTKG